MEEIPRMPMLWFEPKLSPVCPDFAAPIKQAILKYYGEDGNSFDREIHKLEQLRNEVGRAPTTYEGCALLKRYYSQVYGLVNRFSKEDWRIGVQCVWADIYSGKTTIGDLDLELASTLYNIGVLHIVIGGTRFRKSSDDIKTCCTHFQCAAWAFQHLMDNRKLTRSSDLPDDLLRFCVQISLAQAQVCILEKSMLDKRKPGVVARVASQVVEFYRGALGILEQSAMNTDSVNIVDTCGSKLYRSWKKIVELMIHYYWAIFHYYMGDYAEEQQKMGERVGWYESADYRIKEANKLTKERDCKATESAIKTMQELITVKFTNAVKENDFIYHEKVVPADSLEELKGGPLVKGIAFSVTDPEILIEDIFARLVPIEAHETASIFSAELDEIRRNTNTKVEDVNHDLAVYLSALQLDKKSLRSLPKDDIPDELIEICAFLSCSQKELIENIENNLKNLDDLCEDVEKLIEESKNLLQDEEDKEKKHQEMFNLSRPQSLIFVELSKELSKHEESHLKAVESNRSLWENFDRHKEDIRIMSTSSAAKIESILPSNRDITYDEDVCKELERLFDKIEEMKNQRDMLHQKLLKQIDETNVLKYAVAHSKPEVEVYFKKETEKFNETIKYLEQNFVAQQNILSAMTKINAKYGDTRKSIMNIHKNRQARIAGLIYSRDVFNELQTNSDKGTKFYIQFKENLIRLNARIRGVCKVQDEKRTQMINPGISVQNERTFIGQNTMPAQSQQFKPIISNLENIQTNLGEHDNSGLNVSVPGPGAKLKDYLAYMKVKNGDNKTVAGSQVSSQLPISSIPNVPSPQQPAFSQQNLQNYPLQQQQTQPLQNLNNNNSVSFSVSNSPNHINQASFVSHPQIVHHASIPSSSYGNSQNIGYPAGTSNTYSSLGQPIPSVVPIQQPSPSSQQIPFNNNLTSAALSSHGQPQYNQNVSYPIPNQSQTSQQQVSQPISPYHQNLNVTLQNNLQPSSNSFTSPQHPQFVNSQQQFWGSPQQQSQQTPVHFPQQIASHSQQVPVPSVQVPMNQPQLTIHQQQVSIPPQTGLQPQPALQQQVHVDPQQVSQHPQQVCQHPQQVSQHPQQVSQHPQQVSQHPQQVSQHPQQVSQHPQQVSQHPQQVSQHPQQVSQHPQQVFQNSQPTIQQIQPLSQHPQPPPISQTLPQYMQPTSQYLQPSSQPMAQYQQQIPAVYYGQNNGNIVQQPINIQQQLENESKLGWAVLTPTKATEKQLPDILSSMSISGQNEASNNVTVQATNSNSNSTEKTDKTVVDQTSLDILSQFDPLSN